MARNYRTSPGQYLDFTYKVPQEQLLGVIESLDQKIAATEAGAYTLSEYLQGEVIQEDQPAFQEKLRKYQSEIDEITSGIQQDPLQYRKYMPKVTNLGRTIQRDWLTGEASAMFKRKGVYDEMVKQYKETYKDNPILANYAVSNIKVDPLNYNPSTGTYGQISGANMVKHVDAKEITNMVNQIVDNIKDTDLEVYGLTRQDLSRWESAWQSGKVTGREFEDITNMIMSQIPGDVFMSAQQWSNAVAQATGTEPVDEYQVWIEDEEGNRIPNLNTQIGSIVFGASAARTKSEFKVTSSMKSRDYDAIAATNLAYKKKYKNWNQKSPGIYGKFTAGEQVDAFPTYKETSKNLYDSRSALDVAKQQLSQLEPGTAEYKDVNARISSLESDIENYESIITAFDKQMADSPAANFSWGRMYADYQKDAYEYGLDPIGMEDFKKLVREGLNPAKEKNKNNWLMRQLDKMGITNDDTANMSNHYGIIDKYNGKYKKAVNRFGKSEEIVHLTGTAPYFTGFDSGPYKSTVGAYESTLTKQLSNIYADYKTVQGKPLIGVNGKGGILNDDKYATRDPSKDISSPGLEYFEGKPVFLLSIFDEDGKVLGREKVTAITDIGNETQLLNDLGEKMWQSYEYGSAEWQDGVKMAAYANYMEPLHLSGIAHSEEAVMQLGEVTISMKRHPVTNTITATLTDPDGNSEQLKAKDQEALAVEIYKIANQQRLQQSANNVAPPLLQSYSEGETEYNFTNTEDE